MPTTNITLIIKTAEGFTDPALWDWNFLLENYADAVHIAEHDTVRAVPEVPTPRPKAPRLGDIRNYARWANDPRATEIPSKVALVSAQGTACGETVVCAACDTPERRAEVEAYVEENRTSYAIRNIPLRDSWTDVSDNEACWCACGRRHNEGFNGFTADERALVKEHVGKLFEFHSPFENHEGWVEGDRGEIIGLRTDQDGLEDDQERDLWDAKNLRTGEINSIWGGEAFEIGTRAPVIYDHRFTNWSPEDGPDYLNPKYQPEET